MKRQQQYGFIVALGSSIVIGLKYLVEKCPVEWKCSLNLRDFINDKTLILGSGKTKFF